ncbi:Ca2+-dependent phosphoinositide-specific phospholipase C [Phenylobacterium sp. LjRoot219]|uniref:Ca2+-dependent phosphoinositide-specific phospholipase C n=1 Tax=Phenylobacterium sp. LjRoot219 TaxID=3342283 RepID=UPI003ECE24B2
METHRLHGRQRPLFKLALSLLGAATLAGPSAEAASPQRLDELLWLGSHNSYRPAPSPADLARLRKYGSRTSGLEYGHPPIGQQLDLGLRQLDFDIWADSRGGLYSTVHADDLVQQAAMGKPGPKVMHMRSVDEHTSCPTLEECLRQVADWSRRHPKHDLILVFLSAKEIAPIPGGPKPEAWTPENLSGVDELVTRTFGRDRLLTPDDVRGKAESLRAAVLAHHWPKRAAARGKVMVVLDAPPRVAELYRQGHPALQGRAMFGLYDEAAPEAAVLDVPDPRRDEARIRQLVGEGFLVRTRADADTREARAGDLGRFEAALRSKAQIVTTEYYPGAPDPLGLKFVVKVPTTTR